MGFSPKIILVPLAFGPEDEMELARDSVEAACSMAQAYRAKLVLLNICSTSGVGANASLDMSGEIYRTMALVQQEIVKRSSELLKKIQEEVTQKNIPVESRVVESLENTSAAICEVAIDLNADLILLSGHARRGLKRLFLGSVAEKVAHQSSVPVLLIHHH